MISSPIIARGRPLIVGAGGRIAVALGQLAAVAVLVFGLTALLPGDAADVILGQQATAAQVATLRTQLALDRPVLQRFGDWIGGVFTGDLGRSLATGTPVTDELASRLSSTATLGVLAIVVIVPIALAVGIAAGRRPGSRTDRVVTTVCTAGQAVPEFALGLLLMEIFAVWLGWLPATAGNGTFGGPAVLVLPVAVLVIGQVGRLTRQIRVGVIDTGAAPHVTHLRRLGLRERTLLWKHVVPGAIVPTIQQLARVIDGLLGGVVVVEAMFGLRGCGAGFVTAVQGRDIPMIQGYALLFAVTTIVVNQIADTAAARLSPYREVLG